MITIVKAPIENAVFLAANPLKIEIESNEVPGHYFTVSISINDVHFDTQGWSKFNDVTCIIDLEEMFSNIFSNTFTEISETQLAHHSDLLKKINIRVEEFFTTDNTVINYVDLPAFYVLNTTISQNFNHTVNLQKLSHLSNTIKLQPTSNYSLPIWINSDTITVQLLENDIALLNQTHNNLTKGAYSLNFKLSDYNFTENELTIRITNAETVLEQQIIFHNDIMYEISQLYFKNHFAIFEYIEIFGSRKSTNSFTRKKYSLSDNTEYVANTITKPTHKIYTGYLFDFEIPILEAVNYASEIYYNKNNSFIAVIPISKKAMLFNNIADSFDDYIELQENISPTIEDSFNYD